MAVPLGYLEVARMLGVERKTVHQWRRRGVIPAADYAEVNGSCAWKRSTILRWAGRTGRLSDDGLVAEYVARYGTDPVPYRAPRRPAS